jgi:hypothetical protein
MVDYFLAGRNCGRVINWRMRVPRLKLTARYRFSIRVREASPPFAAALMRRMSSSAFKAAAWKYVYLYADSLSLDRYTSREARGRQACVRPTGKQKAMRTEIAP